VQGAAPYFNTEEAETEEETTEEEATEEGEEAEEADLMRFKEQHEGKHGGKHHEKKHHEKKHHKKGEVKSALKKAKKSAHKSAKKHAAHIKAVGHKAAKALKKLSKTLAGKKRKNGKGFHHGANGKLVGPNGKALKKPKMGKPNNHKRSPSTKTPKAAGGRALPPMPAPLPKAFKINCKLNPKLCIDAETPAEGEEPGDHSPKAVFKKKMEVIKKALMQNNRNIASESKWIDEVELIMKQYTHKTKKVREHIADERKAIKELLRQRRIILNEKKQKELENKLKMATTELTSLTDALQQVQKKEKELGGGKNQLRDKIKALVTGLKTLRTDNDKDKAQALKKSF